MNRRSFIQHTAIVGTTAAGLPLQAASAATSANPTATPTAPPAAQAPTSAERLRWGRGQAGGAINEVGPPSAQSGMVA